MGEVIVFTKVPERGYVKTKLQKELQSHVVEELYTALLKDALEKLGDYTPYVAYYPERKQQMLWTILGDRNYIVQRGKGMWERIVNVFNDFYRMGFDYVAAVNCDAPSLTKGHVEEAFALMRDNDLVLGPAYDGGFYLIGGRGLKQGLFEGAEWKSRNALETIAENARKQGLNVAYTERLRDIDTPEDVKAVWESQKLDKNGKTYEILARINKQIG
ncbi:MAG: DUF2064 domain-containing protein [Candidatus Altiarchaeales archaeon]|nr:DUF2064 domain-containing protein [Candidatus Altiarchaeales archaeon]MBD3416405.1 DUF2064 domain-containing protein [Candidatus Altiarchaeales archaeon]